MQEEKFLIATNHLSNTEPNGLTAFYSIDKYNKGNFTYHIPAAKKFSAREEAEEFLVIKKWKDCFVMSTHQL